MIIRDYIEDDYRIKEYDNGTVVRQLISQATLLEPVEPQITLEEQIYAENLYQTALLEMQMLGGE